MQSDQSEIIVKTVKEVCAEGLIVSGGKDGIFIKEVKPESPASKLLSVKEGEIFIVAHYRTFLNTAKFVFPPSFHLQPHLCSSIWPFR